VRNVKLVDHALDAGDTLRSVDPKLLVIETADSTT